MLTQRTLPLTRRDRPPVQLPQPPVKANGPTSRLINSIAESSDAIRCTRLARRKALKSKYAEPLDALEEALDAAAERLMIVYNDCLADCGPTFKSYNAATQDKLRALEIEAAKIKGSIGFGLRMDPKKSAIEWKNLQRKLDSITSDAVSAMHGWSRTVLRDTRDARIAQTVASFAQPQSTRAAAPGRQLDQPSSLHAPLSPLSPVQAGSSSTDRVMDQPRPARSPARPDDYEFEAPPPDYTASEASEAWSAVMSGFACSGDPHLPSSTSRPRSTTREESPTPPHQPPPYRPAPEVPSSSATEPDPNLRTLTPVLAGPDPGLRTITPTPVTQPLNNSNFSRRSTSQPQATGSSLESSLDTTSSSFVVHGTRPSDDSRGYSIHNSASITSSSSDISSFPPTSPSTSIPHRFSFSRSRPPPSPPTASPPPATAPTPVSPINRPRQLSNISLDSITYNPTLNATLTGIPNKTNNYWGFCKGAWDIQSSSPRALGLCTVPVGTISTRRFIECNASGCRFQGRQCSDRNQVSVEGRVMVHPDTGIRFRWLWLAKCHLKCVDKDTGNGINALKQWYGCLFCVADGRPTPRMEGVDALMAHVLRHHTENDASWGGQLREDMKRRNHVITGRVAEASEAWDLNIPKSWWELFLGPDGAQQEGAGETQQTAEGSPQVAIGARHGSVEIADGTPATPELPGSYLASWSLEGARFQHIR